MAGAYVQVATCAMSVDSYIAKAAAALSEEGLRLSSGTTCFRSDLAGLHLMLIRHWSMREHGLSSTTTLGSPTCNCFPEQDDNPQDA